jgi:AraC-like DNA-binding protein
VLDQSFNDVGHFSKAIGWDMDFRQLDSGKLDVRTTTIAGQNVQLVKFHLNRGFHQLGSAPEGMLTFGVPDRSVHNFTWCSKDTPGGSLTNFNLQGGFDCVSQAGFTGFALLLCPQYLQYLAGQLGLSSAVESLVTGETNWYSPETLALSAKLESVYREAARSDCQAVNGQTEFISEEIGFAILKELTHKRARPQLITVPHKVKILRMTLEILNDADELPITVAQLCDRVGTSYTTLNRIFLSEYGISPKAYIRSRCLSAARDELASALPDSKVSDIANHWGFWHMGQFAKDFRIKFGELPSHCHMHALRSV